MRIVSGPVREVAKPKGKGRAVKPKAVKPKVARAPVDPFGVDPVVIDRRRRLVALADGKRSQAGLAEELGVTVSTVKSDVRLLRAGGVSVPLMAAGSRGCGGRPCRPEVAGRRAIIAARAAKGRVHGPSLAAELGLSLSAFHKDVEVLRAAGVGVAFADRVRDDEGGFVPVAAMAALPVPAKRPAAVARQARVLDLADGSRGVVAIAREVGAKYSTVKMDLYQLRLAGHAPRVWHSRGVK
jgi:biotin operon repressor